MLALKCCMSCCAPTGRPPLPPACLRSTTAACCCAAQPECGPHGLHSTSNQRSAELAEAAEPAERTLEVQGHWQEVLWRCRLSVHEGWPKYCCQLQAAQDRQQQTPVLTQRSRHDGILHGVPHLQQQAASQPHLRVQLAISYEKASMHLDDGKGRACEALGLVWQQALQPLGP